MVVGGRQAHCVLGTLKMVLDNSGIYVCVPTAREAKEGRAKLQFTGSKKWLLCGN